jgi:pimeloyl-ACP methyl ester carboxylesterase
MKTIIRLQKYFLLVLVTLVFFACQDQVSDELTRDQQSEDVSSYKFDDDANARKKRNIYVLVHGAWHPESSWKDIKWLLEGCGHTVVTVQLPGLGNDATPVEQVTFQDHVDAVKNVVQQQSGRVILVGHSYGGAVISQVGEEVPQKIDKLVYVSGFMPVNGEMVVQLALANTESLVTQNLIVDGITAFLTPEYYGKALYSQALTSYNPLIVYQAKKMITKLRPHPFATLVTPLHLTSAYDGLEKVYISCLKDKAVTPAAQHGMYSRFPETTIYKIPHSDHSPFITTPVSLTDILRKQ